MSFLKKLYSFSGMLLSQVIPEGNFKEWLRRLFWKRRDSLFALEEKLNKVEAAADNLLYTELGNGLQLALPRDGVVDERLRIIKEQRFPCVKKFQHYTSCLWILREVYVEGIYEKHYRLKEGDTVVDIGAHVGIFTTAAAKAVGPGGLVIAIEPEINNYQLLLKNIELNNLSNVVAVNCGVWSEPGKLVLNLFGGQTALSSFLTGHYEATERPDASQDVEVDSLDNILAVQGVKRVSLIKMDIEGGEIEAVKGMQKTLAQPDVNLAFAAYHIVDGEPTFKTIIPGLTACGYTVSREGEITYAWKSRNTENDEAD